MKRETVVTEERVTTVRLTAGDVVKALRAMGVPIPDGDVNVWMRVPGGGDYSNEDLHVHVETPLCVRWRSRTSGGAVD